MAVHSSSASSGGSFGVGGSGPAAYSAQEPDAPTGWGHGPHDASRIRPPPGRGCEPVAHFSSYTRGPHPEGQLHYPALGPLAHSQALGLCRHLQSGFVGHGHCTGQNPCSMVSWDPQVPHQTLRRTHGGWRSLSAWQKQTEPLKVTFSPQILPAHLSVERPELGGASKSWRDGVWDPPTPTPHPPWESGS